MECHEPANLCHLCFPKVPGQYYCNVCKQNLCRRCEKIHRHLATTKDHVVDQLPEIGYTKKCPEHGIDVSFHCDNCYKPVCSKCITDVHRGHSFSELSVPSGNKPNILLQRSFSKIREENVLDLEEKCKPIIKSCFADNKEEEKSLNFIGFLKQQKLQREKSRLNNDDGKKINVKEISKDVVAKTERPQTALWDFRQAQMAITEKKDEDFDKKQRPFSARTYRTTEIECVESSTISTSMHSQSLFEPKHRTVKTNYEVNDEIVSTRQVLPSPKDSLRTVELDEDSEKSVSSISPRQHLVKAAELGDRSIGQKHKTMPSRSFWREGKENESDDNKSVSFLSSAELSEPNHPSVLSRFKSPLPGWPSICITKKEHIWIGGTNSNQLVKVDAEGHVLSSKRIKCKPYALAAMDCGDIIMCPDGRDSSVAVRLNMMNVNEVILFNASPSCCEGVSVTSNQKILLCTLDGRVVKCDGNGFSVRHIYQGSKNHSALHAVEDAEGFIYINDHTNSRIIMVEEDGHKRSVFPLDEIKVLGLVLDRLGNLLCACRKSNCVYIINTDKGKLHQVTELVGPSFGIRKPRWLAIDKDDRLWITQIDGTIHVVKYLYE